MDGLVNFWGHGKSHVWKHFGFRKNEKGEIEKSKAVCRLCQKEYAYAGKKITYLVFITNKE